MKNANAVLERLDEARKKEDFTRVAAFEKALALNLSGHVLHSIFWQNLMKKGGGKPQGALAEAVTATRAQRTDIAGRTIAGECLEDDAMNERAEGQVRDREAGPREVIVRGGAVGFAQQIAIGPHRLAADEPTAAGGTDGAPNPYDLLLASLGSCTSMTVGLYARRKQWPLEAVTVRLRHARIHATDCSECETREGMIERIEVDLELAGPLTEAQRATLLEIAGRCPVHRTLTSEIDIRTHLSA